MEKSKGNLAIYQKYMELIDYTNNIVRKYPKSETFALVKEIKNTLYSGLRLLMYTIKVFNKQEKLKFLNELDINLIYNMNSIDSLTYLTNFKGIGNKVASCILLFAYQKFDVYPIDTWVKKFMKEDYNIEGENLIRAFTSNTYKEYSGLAIQYMFNYKRNKN